MTRPVVVVLGEVDDPPPGIEAAAADVELRYAARTQELIDLAPQADAVYFWRADRDQLPAAWPRFHRLRWIQSASAGVIRISRTASSHGATPRPRAAARRRGP